MHRIRRVEKSIFVPQFVTGAHIAHIVSAKRDWNCDVTHLNDSILMPPNVFDNIVWYSALWTWMSVVDDFSIRLFAWHFFANQWHFFVFGREFSTSWEWNEHLRHFWEAQRFFWRGIGLLVSKSFARKSKPNKKKYRHCSRNLSSTRWTHSGWPIQ